MGSKPRLRPQVADSIAQDVIKMVKAGESPLDFLLRITRDDGIDLETRVDAAKAAAPYVHRKQPQAVEVNNTTPIAVSIITPLSNANPSNSGG